MFQNIIFDWSGVVNDNVHACYLAYVDIFKAFNTDPITFEEFKREFKLPYMDFIHQYMPHVTQKDQHEIYKNSIIKYDKNKIFKGIDQSIKIFFNHNVNLFIISSDHPETLLNQIKIFGLNGLFTEIICNVEDKSIEVENLAKKYNFDLDKTIFIGDSNHEIESGKKIGIKTGAVTWGFCSEEKLKSFNPDFMIHNLTELEKIILK
ncbi:MAG: HAD family hydrolase [Candidatus Shapirobacteria bacterium]